MVNPVRAAIVGCGMISDVYLKNARGMFSILNVVGCCDVRSEAASARAEQFGIRAMSMREILDDPTIELAINLTAPGAHYAVIRELLEGGKHVYTEKVLSLTYSEAAELVRLAEEKRLYLGAAPDTFLGSALQTARAVLDSGMLGEVTGCMAVLNRDNRVGAEFIPYLTRAGGGIGFDVGIYHMTALLYLLGPIAEVGGFSATRNPERTHYLPSKGNFGETYAMECENQMAGALRFESGAMGTVLFNSESIMNRYPRLEIYGTQGILYLPDPDGFGGDVKILRRGNPEPTAVQQNHGFSANSRGVGAAELCWALRKGRPPRADGSMAAHAVEALEGIVESGRAGRTVALESRFDRLPPLPQGYLRASEFADFLADEEAALVE